MNQPLLKIQNLSIRFGSGIDKFFAVQSVSLSVFKGKTLGIVGESGSGKTLTALAALGLLPGSAFVESGSIVFTSENIKSTELINSGTEIIRQIRGKKIGMIFQEPMSSLNPVMRCGKQVAESLVVHKKLSWRESKKKVLTLFDKVLLPDPERVFRSYPHELSGGQKQRVMIAIAMACEPELLIADEPTTALDVTVQKNLLLLLKKLQHENQLGILFISHDLSVIAQISDDVAVMQTGRIVEYGTAETLFKNPSHPYTKGLLACRPVLGQRPLRLPLVDDFINVGSGKLAIKLQSPEARAKNHQMLYAREPLLIVKNLTVDFVAGKRSIFQRLQNIRAVGNVSLTVYPGETLGLVGESGSGKTTLGRALLHLIDYQSGEVWFMGRNLQKLQSRDLRKMRSLMQIIFQDPFSSLNPRIPIGEAIVEPMAVHKLFETSRQRHQKMKDLLQQVGLNPSHYRRYPHEFSGGQRQRICIARALASKPKFLICDESVSSLDVSIQAQVLNLLNDLKKDFGFSCIFISHDLSVVNYMADRIAVMKNGSIVDEGEADQLLVNPLSEYTRSLVESVPQIPEK
ncbi:MAG TPA: ABC transporter ATP-binding protein [Bacteroidales bacterium]|nr:ABC transporter ATP-binding protein [Bacteroidales bacterium]